MAKSCGASVMPPLTGVAVAMALPLENETAPLLAVPLETVNSAGGTAWVELGSTTVDPEITPLPMAVVGG